MVAASQELAGATNDVRGANRGALSSSGTARAATEDMDRGASEPVAASVADEAWWVDAGGVTEVAVEAPGKRERRERVAVGARKVGVSCLLFPRESPVRG